MSCAMSSGCQVHHVAIQTHTTHNIGTNGILQHWYFVVVSLKLWQFHTWDMGHNSPGYIQQQIKPNVYPSPISNIALVKHLP